MAMHISVRAGMCGIITLVGTGFLANGVKAFPPRWPENGVEFSNQESNHAFPEHPPGINDIEEIKDLDPHRELADNERNYILALCDYLIDKRYEYGNRETAARHLGIYGHSLAIPALLAVIRDEEDNVEVRNRAIRALGNIRDKRVVMYIVEEGLSSVHNDLIIASGEALIALSDVPPKLKQGDLPWHWAFRPPPGYSNKKSKRDPVDPEELEAYLDIWREWWRENHDKVTLHRPSGIP